MTRVPRHGTVGEYRHGCRCLDCRAAWLAYFTEWKASRVPLKVGDRRHGTTNAYINWGCRCRRCRAAWTAYRYELAQRRREAMARATRRLTSGGP